METLGPFKGIYTVIEGLCWGYIGIKDNQMENKMETTLEMKWKLPIGVI